MSEIRIESKSMPLSYWQDILSESQYEKLLEMVQHDFPLDWETFNYSAYEVFEYLVLYEDGVYALQALSLIRTLYGIDLR